LKACKKKYGVKSRKDFEAKALIAGLILGLSKEK
jgi:hypothetical protein